MAAQSDPQGSEFSAAELEFLAEDEMIEIVPNMRMESLNLISVLGDFGPFHPQISTQVPLWLAVALKKRGKCTIRPPEWMLVEKLMQVLEAERDSQKSFQPLPFHYVEISRLLFDHARDDIPDIYMVRSLIEDIKDVRFYKIGTGLEVISQRTTALKLNHLTAMEVNIVRPFLVKALQTFNKLDNAEIQESEPNRQVPAANRGPKRPLKR
ncbi:DNA replication complex GINS protein PSF2-like isoform X1 [Actinidia eriantha]|uniref:DNA replication complex GINS protein PSF2-like isoform X1 n=1 Tax=Actinidia eriantha TaxID=165200 RepID=UPI00258B3292|nr:DNA replication complex GINS protein PSF2-like isoform X1 [Actinidia eriantha]